MRRRRLRVALKGGNGGKVNDGRALEPPKEEVPLVSVERKPPRTGAVSRDQLQRPTPHHQ